MSSAGTFGITGLPPGDVTKKTDPQNHIPYVVGMPQRREITEFFTRMNQTTNATEKDLMQKQWTLFVLGFDRFKKLPVDERLSYFQLAGIHGSPLAPWDGADKPADAPDPGDLKPGTNPFGGYCHHNTIGFPTWHRPYVLVFEQALWLSMRAIVKQWVDDQTIAKSESDAWYKAADKWRLFYWDWAKTQQYPESAGQASWNNFGVPLLFTKDVVPVFLPGKTSTDHPNPLWNFENPEKDANGKPLPMGQMPKGKEMWNLPDTPVKPNPDEPWAVPFPWSKCTGTSRWGILYDSDKKEFTGLEGKNEWSSSNHALASAGPRFSNPGMGDSDWSKQKPGHLADVVNRMFSVNYNPDWGTFASTKWFAERQTGATDYLSLEYIHNDTHSFIGGTSLGQHVGEKPGGKPNPPDPDNIYGLGHMGDVPVAAFDPIFWFFHCNVDRLFAMWQCLNWNKWFNTESTSAGSENVADIKSSDPLDPFHLHDGGDPKDANNRWTSDIARDWTNFGYQYPDLIPEQTSLNTSTGRIVDTAYKLQLQQHIHKLYEGTGDQAWAIANSPLIGAKFFFGAKTAAQGAFTDYLLNIVYDRYALGGRSYTIVFSLAGEYVGQVFSFGGMQAGTEIGHCKNCGQQQGGKILSKAQIPISIHLMRRFASEFPGGVGMPYVEEQVEAFVALGLTWEFYGTGEGKLDKSLFPDTTINLDAGKAMWSFAKETVGKVVQGVTGMFAQGIHAATSAVGGEEKKVPVRPPFFNPASYRSLLTVTGDGPLQKLRDLPGLPRHGIGFIGNGALEDFEMPEFAPEP